ncbi:tetratricopeptide repeat protein [Chromobacterium alticapitis]|uniref:Uncharacterized protein n=1 Tax=Chromobacterium alticapitis TaxID=2073169 RepID=A0A2S5DJD5_9NEIS|nr:tetratricopeptide repeat protein [Chromobacterium alticapitis]POZ63186.1 hypothetical protein C2I19_05100 [Chromobacterium alticapitis]
MAAPFDSLAIAMFAIRAFAGLLAGSLLAWSAEASALDLSALWDFDHPALSEQRFRAAQTTAAPDDFLILQTQIARSYGLRGDFVQARALLSAVQPRLAGAGLQAQARYWLEWGRSWVSATHPREQLSEDARKQARAAYLQADALARSGGLDALAIDAQHMLALVETDAAAQLRWNREALRLAETSGQANARQWRASLRNNIGCVLYQQGDYPKALDEFQQALALRQQGGDAAATRVAWWMVAWTLHAMKRQDEALAIQLRLERENAAAGDPDPDVFDELAKLYRERGDGKLADHYETLRQQAQAAG